MSFLLLDALERNTTEANNSLNNYKTQLGMNALMLM